MSGIDKDMIFALDFDGTYTADPDLWTLWAKSAMERGHTVLCITFRRHDEMQKVHDTLGMTIGVHNCRPTGGSYKKTFAQDNNIKVDVWIDDNPEMIVTSEQVEYWHTSVKFA